jgi:hypothetical protein
MPQKCYIHKRPHLGPYPYIYTPGVKCRDAEAAHEKYKDTDNFMVVLRNDKQPR